MVAGTAGAAAGAAGIAHGVAHESHRTGAHGSAQSRWWQTFFSQSRTGCSRHGLLRMPASPLAQPQSAGHGLPQAFGPQSPHGAYFGARHFGASQQLFAGAADGGGACIDAESFGKPQHSVERVGNGVGVRAPQTMVFLRKSAAIEPAGFGIVLREHPVQVAFGSVEKPALAEDVARVSEPAGRV